MSRTILHPTRAFSVIKNYRPAMDVIAITAIGAVWTLMINFGGILRVIKNGQFPIDQASYYLAQVLAGYLAALVLTIAYAIAVSMAAEMQGGRVRPLAIFLAFILSTVIGISVMSVPIAILKLAEYGSGDPALSSTLVMVLPWVYIVVLWYIALRKLLQFESTRCAVILILAALPLSLLLVLIEKYIPSGFYIGTGW